jgi:hypothetical protein
MRAWPSGSASVDVTDSAPTSVVLAARLGLVDAGMGLLGVLAATRYDALVPAAWGSPALRPGARAALVVASGGRALFAAFSAAPEASLARPKAAQRGEAERSRTSSEPLSEPLDAYTVRVVETAARCLGGGARALFAFEQRGGVYADFVALGQAAGLGAPSRLGLLLHPEFGPWMSIRAVLLTEKEVAETGPAPGFDPCGGCPAPCVRACRGGAVPAAAGVLDSARLRLAARPPALPLRFDVAACRATRSSEPGCRLRCDSRRSCVIGPDHAYSPEAEAHHMGAILET